MYTNYYASCHVVIYRGKNKFEVMYTRGQVQYEAENIMQLLIIHIIYVY